MSRPTEKWQGVSGRFYSFEIFNIDENFTSHVYGNYIFAKHSQDGWEAVYIGEGNLYQLTKFGTIRDNAKSKGAVQIHAHINMDESSRKSEVADLLAFNTEAYEPTGCNVKAGG